VRTLAQHVGYESLGGVGALGTTLLHGAVILLIVFGRQSAHRPPLPAYSVQLVAAPRAAAEADVATTGADVTPSARTAPTATSRRPTAKSATRAVSRQPSAVSRQPSAVPQPSAVSPQPSAVSRPPSAPAVSPNTSAAPGSGTGPANIRTEGVEFPFPGYLRNLVSQVYRRWHPPANNADLEAEMLFFVHRDGSITGLQFVRRSGAFAFDLEAQGAVEAAARAGTFGSLPQGFGPDVLPVSFFFSPRSLR
jgi:protein TonB